MSTSRPSLRFRAEQHVRRQTDIRSVREKGRRVDCGAFTVWWKQREHGAETINVPRVCVIASSKAVGPAVRRNRARRRLREVFRNQQHHAHPGCDLLLIARDTTNAWPLSQLESKFIAACQQISGAVEKK